MKKLVFSAALVSVLLLGACGDTETEKLSGTTNSEETNSTNEENSETTETAEEESEETSEDINEVVVDNENYKATLLNIVKKTDDIWGNSIDVTFEIENKMDKTIGVQSRSVSADGYMVDEALISMSQEVVAGKKAKAVLTISDYEGYDFPELNSDFEMQLHFFDYDSFEDIAQHEVKVSF